MPRRSPNHAHSRYCMAAALLTLTGCAGSSSTGTETTSGGSQSVGGASTEQSGRTTGGGTGLGGSTTGIRASSTGGLSAQGGTATSAGVGGTSAVAHTGGASSGGSTARGTGGSSATGGMIGFGGSSTSGGRSAGAGGTLGTGGNGIGGRSGGIGGNAGDTTGGRSTGNGGVASTSGGTTGTGPGGTTSVAGTGNSDTSIIPDPSWACGMPSGIPAPTRGELVFSATLNIDKTYNVGQTQFGNRRLLTVKGGSIDGKQVQATALSGGMELELTLSNGSIELEEINILKTSDDTLIYMRTCGVAPAGDSTVRIVPDFEVATSKPLAWLNSGKYAGTRSVDTAAGKIQLDVYDISKVSVADPKVQLTDPAGVPNQPWECSTATGNKGSTLFTEAVTLGSSLSVGTSKNGNRNIIPITGGTITGGTLLSSLSGSIISAGADYQLVGGSSTKLDARYALSSKDGEYIVVRNCGPMGSLVPTFETRADGPYAVLNTNKYVSGDPGSASGGVSITFYERK